MAIINPDELLAQLTSEEKIRLLSGDDMWHTVAVPRLNIPRVRVRQVSPPLYTEGERERERATLTWCLRCLTVPTVSAAQRVSCPSLLRLVGTMF